MDAYYPVRISGERSNVAAPNASPVGQRVVIGREMVTQWGLQMLLLDPLTLLDPLVRQERYPTPH